nr:immunoglobulin heavy chain junction region [Mus musculus]MBK4184622.1 immunoglobulin heavy chain junction region [Mus musculus]
CARGSLAFW